MITKISPDGGKSVLQILNEKRVKVSAPCGGHGRCGKCKVRIKGDVTPITEDEKKRLTDSEISEGIRLACVAKPLAEIEVETDNRGGIDVMTESSAAVSGGGAVLDSGYAVGVDIGTTTVAVYLCDLASGTVTKTAAFGNPQAGYGADVISRLSYIRENEDGLKVLQGEIISALDREISSFGVPVSYVCIAGNTVMQHIAAGLDPSGIAVAPFTPESLFGDRRSAASIGLASCGEADVFFMPCAASYVGGDIISGLCACGVDTSDKTILYIDIGTNGEIALAHGGRIVTAACAAGPAFEGAGIECGCPGIPGAISDIELSDGSVGSYRTIGGEKPIGICGSALISLVSQLYDAEIVEDSGFMEDDFPITEGVYLTPQDVRQVQLAKAAIGAGILTLMDSEGVSCGDIDAVYIAGGFGAHIDIHAACNIGLIPASLEKVTSAVGNAAGAGTHAWLLGEDIRSRVDRTGRETGYIELSGDKRFSDHYMDQMFFGLQ